MSDIYTREDCIRDTKLHINDVREMMLKASEQIMSNFYKRKWNGPANIVENLDLFELAEFVDGNVYRAIIEHRAGQSIWDSNDHGINRTKYVFDNQVSDIIDNSTYRIIEKIKAGGMPDYDHYPKVISLLISDLNRRAIVHDKSKMEDPELEGFTEYTPKLKTATYGSDEYEEFRKGLGKALDHHYANNSHHPEYYENGINGMDVMDLIEMICDWAAAVRRHDNGNLNKSLEVNTKRFGIHDQLRGILQNTIDRLDTNPA